MSIFLVEDDDSIRELVLYTLQNAGYHAKGFRCAKDFYSALKQQNPSLVLLDIMLPDEDGIEILKKLRANPFSRQTPVIMLTAKGTEYDKVLGLDLGADDYIAKPFGMMELLSRIRAVLRRSEREKESQMLVAGCIAMDIGRRIVKVHGKEVQLTMKEFELLQMLMENKLFALTREQLLQRIWGYTFDAETRTVDVHVRTLRQKLGEGGALIETVRGFGYRMREDS